MNGCEFCSGPLRRTVDILCQTCLTEMAKDRAFAAIVTEVLSRTSLRPRLDDEEFAPFENAEVNYEVTFEMCHS